MKKVLVQSDRGAHECIGNEHDQIVNFCRDVCGSRKTVLQVDWAKATRERFYLWSFAMAHGLMD